MAGAAAAVVPGVEGEARKLTKQERDFQEKEARKAREAEEKQIKARFRQAQQRMKEAGKVPRFAVVDPKNETLEEIGRLLGFGIIHKAKMGGNFDLLEHAPEDAAIVPDPNAKAPNEKKRGHGMERAPAPRVRIEGGIPVKYAQFISPVSLVPGSPSDQHRTLRAGSQPLGRTKSAVGMVLQGSCLRVRVVEENHDDLFVLVPITNVAFMQETPKEEVEKAEREDALEVLKVIEQAEARAEGGGA